MTKPSNHIRNTDFATLKNDDDADATVVFPASVNIAANSYLEYKTDLVIGAQASINRVQIINRPDDDPAVGRKRYVSKSVVFTRIGTGIYDIVGYVHRISPTTIRCSAYIANPYGVTLTTDASMDDTFDFFIDTFIPPYA